MEGQSTEDKLSVLNTIFGNDLTQSVITNTLRDNNNSFDPAVEKLLTLPANKVRPPPPQTQPPAPKDGENINRLHTMFGDLTQSVITTVYESNQRDVEGTVDTLLNMTSNEVASGVKKEAEAARQEQELRQYEEFKRRQQQLQEQERRATEEAQRAKEAELKQKAAEDAQRKAQHEKKMQDEHTKALQEQERMLFEFQRKRAEEDQAKKSAEEARKLAEAQEKARKVEEETARKLVEQEAARRRAEEIAKLKELTDQHTKEQIEREKRAKEEEVIKAMELRLAAEKKKLEEEVRLRTERWEMEERLKKQQVEEIERELKKQKEIAEAEIKLAEARAKEGLMRQEEERKKAVEIERRLREEQENIKRSWEEKLRKLENERRVEEQLRKEEDAKRAEAKRLEEEERARREADMRKILELERLKLEEQRRRVEEEKKNAEERLKAMELAALKREEEEIERARLEQEEKIRLEEERKREEEERVRLLEEEKQARERLKEEMIKAAAQEQFAASAIMVPPAVDEPKVEILAEVEGTDIKGTWTLLEGKLPSPHAWLGLFARRSINTYTGFQYVNGTSGSFRFKGLTPGHYEVRLFGNKPVTSRIAESPAMLIGPKVVSFSAQMQGDQVMFEYQLDPPVVPNTWDWVGIYEKDQRRNKIYLSSTYGNAAGTISAVLPRTPGDYQARLFVSGAKYNEQSIIEFSVVDNDHVSAELVDGTIKASWVLRTVEPTNSDWIGLFAAGEVYNKYLASVYTHGASAGTVDIPVPKDTPAGTYVLRLFSSKVGKYITFKVSNVITIA